MMDPRVKARLNAKPLLAFIPSALVGALWFLYTFMGVFKERRLEGRGFYYPADNAAGSHFVLGAL